MGKRGRRRQRLRDATTTTVLTETAGTWADLEEATGAVAEVRIISPGWGSRGFYSAELLERDGPTAFPAGTHMFLDHPTDFDASQRPERSLRDLAGFTEAAARWDANHREGPGLYAPVRVLDVFRPVLAEAADHIGVSIRARGVSHNGTAEGRSGPIVDQIVEGLSVDFVTSAGRGGKIVELLESARAELRPGDTPLEEARNVAEWFQSRIHLRFTEFADDMFGEGRLTKPERIALSAAIGSALEAFDDTLSDSAPQLYDRDLWDLPQATTDPTITEESSDMALTDQDKKDLAALLAEAVKPLVDATSTETVTESKTDPDDDTMSDGERKRAERLLHREALDAARSEFTGKGTLAEAAKVLPQVTIDRLVESAAKDAPHDDNLDLDAEKLVEALAESTKQAAAEFAAATGAGKVTGMGGAPLTEADKDTSGELAAEFQRLGLSESAAKTAAAGR